MEELTNSMDKIQVTMLSHRQSWQTKRFPTTTVLYIAN